MRLITKAILSLALLICGVFGAAAQAIELPITALSAMADQLVATAVTLPDTGVDMPGLIGAAGTALGVIVAAAVGVYFAFWAIRQVRKFMKV